MGFKPEDVLMMQRRLARGSEPVGGGDGCESGKEVEELHNPAIKWLTGCGIAFCHNRTDLKSTATPGAPDFAICVNGQTIWIEFKTRTGKLSNEQQTWHWLAKRQGVKVHVLRSYTEFIKLMSMVMVKAVNIFD